MPSYMLNRETAQEVTARVKDVFSAMVSFKQLDRSHLAIVIVDPTIKYLPMDDIKAEFARFLLKAVLFVDRFGNRNVWAYPYDKIALSKAFFSWKHGLPSRRIQHEFAYLCEAGTTMYGGSVIDEGGLIVAVSGLDEEYDEMFAGMTMSLCKGYAQKDARRTRQYAEKNEYLGDGSNFYGLHEVPIPEGIDLTKFSGRYDERHQRRCPKCDSRDWSYGPSAGRNTPLVCNNCGHSGSEEEFKIPT